MNTKKKVLSIIEDNLNEIVKVKDALFGYIKDTFHGVKKDDIESPLGKLSSFQLPLKSLCSIISAAAYQYMIFRLITQMYYRKTSLETESGIPAKIKLLP